MNNFAYKIFREPPFRIISRLLIKFINVKSSTKSRWDVVSKPQYLAGLVHAAKEAKAQGVNGFCAVEFGVAAGFGLIELQKYAHLVEHEFDIKIDVVGFDVGTGLPSFCGDHRDHPDLWKEGDYPMNIEKLKSKLSKNTRLVIGEVSETLDEFVKNDQQHPIGFVSFDMDLYSSTVDALGIFTAKGKKILNRVVVYFDDVHTAIYHRKAGEYLALDEFNGKQDDIYIDRWHNVKIDRPFPEAFWTNKMYIAHHIKEISTINVDREINVWSI